MYLLSAHGQIVDISGINAPESKTRPYDVSKKAHAVATNSKSTIKQE